MNAAMRVCVAPPPPPSAVPLPRKRGRIQRRVRPWPLILPCEAGEGDHAKHGGGGSLAPSAPILREVDE